MASGRGIDLQRISARSNGPIQESLGLSINPEVEMAIIKKIAQSLFKRNSKAKT
jgi:hypothetical protein